MYLPMDRMVYPWAKRLIRRYIGNRLLATNIWLLPPPLYTIFTDVIIIVIALTSYPSLCSITSLSLDLLILILLIS